MRRRLRVYYFRRLRCAASSARPICHVRFILAENFDGLPCSAGLSRRSQLSGSKDRLSYIINMQYGLVCVCRHISPQINLSLDFSTAYKYIRPRVVRTHIHSTNIYYIENTRILNRCFVVQLILYIGINA